jgi:hypothetical protein
VRVPCTTGESCKKMLYLLVHDSQREHVISASCDPTPPLNPPDKSGSFPKETRRSFFGQEPATIIMRTGWTVQSEDNKRGRKVSLAGKRAAINCLWTLPGRHLLVFTWVQVHPKRRHYTNVNNCLKIEVHFRDSLVTSEWKPFQRRVTRVKCFIIGFGCHLTKEHRWHTSRQMTAWTGQTFDRAGNPRHVN